MSGRVPRLINFHQFQFPALSKSRRAAVEKYTVGDDAPQPEEEASTFVSNSGKPASPKSHRAFAKKDTVAADAVQPDALTSVFNLNSAQPDASPNILANAWDSVWDSTFQMGVSSTLPVHSPHQVAEFQPHDLSGLDLNSFFGFDPSVTEDLPMGFPSDLSFPETEYSLPLPLSATVSSPKTFSHLELRARGPLAHESGMPGWTQNEEAQDAQDFDKLELNLDSEGPQRVSDLRDGFWE
ncbi:hypothetical protein B0H11DRAFT_1930571 [Mycena galericulata]|nr:hypothetical protein B0H11DRAFT_1930571 [Mycena galericulata]